MKWTLGLYRGIQGLGVLGFRIWVSGFRVGFKFGFGFKGFGLGFR